jgi:hypothetical protein
VGKLLEESGVAAPKHDVVNLQGVLEQLDDFANVVSPLSSTKPLESGQSKVVFVASALLVWQVRQLHRLEDAVDDKRGAKTRSQAEKEHSLIVVASQRLHRSVVDNFDWPLAKGLLEVKANSSSREMVWLGQDTPMHDGPRIAYRYHIVFPAEGGDFD